MNPESKTISLQIRNVAVIAHVDHGKTTLVDKMLKATGAIPGHRELGERILDSNDLEKERGITILAKNISVYHQGVKINLIDTPGHADFGGEVERVLRMADGVLLLVDAAEGPMPQTRFVLRKAFQRRLRPLVVINKIDRPDARTAEVVEEVTELFLELAEELGLESEGWHHDAGDVLDFPVVYASAKLGFAKLSLDDPEDGVASLLDAILEHIPEPVGSLDEPLQLQVASLDYSDYVGRIGIGRVWRGTISVGDRILISGRNGTRSEVIKELWVFDKLGRLSVSTVQAGDICALTGIDSIGIGDTLMDPEAPEALPITEVDRPTISMVFRVNDSPFAGQDGKFVTSRHLRARLYKELESNVALDVQDMADAGAFEVSGRGTLHLGILIENMRRQGYEFQVGKPRVIYRMEDGKRLEPVELMVVQAPSAVSGKVIEALGGRRGELVKFEPSGERMLMEFLVPSRGLIGMGSRLMNLTQGEALVYHSFDSYQPFKGPIPRRGAGVMVASEAGLTMPYALFGLRDRGPMFVGPGARVYEGMIVGEHCRDSDIAVNVCRAKKATNVRSAGADDNVILKPPRQMSIEEALEYIEDDEFLEVTPRNYRLRKKALNEKDRRKAGRELG